MLIDLSLAICPNKSEPEPVVIEYISHVEGANLLGKPAGLSHVDFPEQMGLSLERVALTTHTATHIDAPSHYGPLSEGKPSLTIEDVPLEWFMNDGVILRLDPDPLLGDVQIRECENYLEKINYTIKPFDIVLFHLQGDRYWGQPEYFTQFRGISAEVTNWLINKEVKVIGVDTFGFDAPFNVMLERYKTTNDQSYLWPSHFLGRKKSYCQIERLTNLYSVPMDHGFKIICFPIKIARSGAGWARVVARICEN